MPLKLVPPGKIKGARSFYIRGTHLGVRIFRSAGTDRRALANKELKACEREIERGRYAEPAPAAPRSFADAVLGYLKACPPAEVPRVQRLLDHFKEKPLAEFDKDAIDAGETALYPPRKDKQGRPRPWAAGTLNRNYRTPLAAVLHHAAKRKIMPWLPVEKHEETHSTRWLEPHQAIALIEAARAVDAGKGKNHHARLAPLLVFLFSTGARISEAIGLTWADVDLPRRHVILRDTKNGETYGVHLGDLALEELANLPGGRHPDRQIFGYTQRWSIRWALKAAAKKAKIGAFNIHMTRHSFATWLRRNGEDLRKMMELGRWKSVQSVMRYQHVASDEQVAAIAKLPLPAPAKRTRVKGARR